MYEINLKLRKFYYLPCVNVKPINGKCNPENAEFAVGGTASDERISASSTSKFDVSVGLDTSGMYGAFSSLTRSQSSPSNHGCF